ncbi:MAG: glycoside hydrolase family 16 protein [Planctomycetota bacterium]
MLRTFTLAIGGLASLALAQAGGPLPAERAQRGDSVVAAGVAAGVGALTLRVDASGRDGDVAAVTVEGAPPGAVVFVFYGTRLFDGPRLGALASHAVGAPRLALDLADPRLVHTAFASARGVAKCLDVPPSVGGRSALVQAAAFGASSPAAPAIRVSNAIALPAGGTSAEPDGSGRVGPGPERQVADVRRDRLSSILEVAGVQRWYDPELSRFTEGRWEDLTGNADLRQPSPGARPTLNPTGLNGKPSLTFDGSNDHLVNAAPLLANLDQFTLIMMAKASSGQIDKRLVAEGSSRTTVPLFVPIRTGSRTRTSSPSQLIRNDANVFLFEDSSGPLVFDGNEHFFGVAVDRVAGTVTNFEDVEFDDPDDYTAEGRFSVDRFTLGAMTRTTVQFHFAGEVGPLVVVDRVLSVAEIRQIRDYYEERGYLDAYRREPVLSAVPPGYRLVYDEDFSGYASEAELLEDGQAASEGKPFADSFVAFGVRFLAGNNDRCYKGLGSDTGTGAVPLEAVIGTKPHELANDNLLLRFGEIPPARRGAFRNREHGGGMISSERGFAHGPGLFEVRMRVRNMPPGGHFALWLLTQNTIPHDLEIDLVEIVGNNLFSKDKPLNALFYNGHDRQRQPPRSGSQTTEEVSNHMLNRWHVYSFLYTPTRFTWYRDGVVVRDEEAYFDDSSPLYFLASWESNFATAKNFPGPSEGNNPTFPAEVEIDYLRVYAPP